jgi:hypothetical protein
LIDSLLAVNIRHRLVAAVFLNQFPQGGNRDGALFLFRRMTL